VSNGLYDALRDAGLDLLRAHRLDVYLRTVADDDASAGFARSLQGDPVDLTALRATLLADLDAITTGLALLDR
jgi:hypothetical protein